MHNFAFIYILFRSDHFFPFFLKKNKGITKKPVDIKDTLFYVFIMKVRSLTGGDKKAH